MGVRKRAQRVRKYLKEKALSLASKGCRFPIGVGTNTSHTPGNADIFQNKGFAGKGTRKIVKTKAEQNGLLGRYSPQPSYLGRLGRERE
jgi:hypothetical protein